MPIRAITFDCAGTLVDVSWDPAEFAIQVAGQIGLELPSEAKLAYQRLQAQTYAEYLALNRRKQPGEGRKFYIDLTADWLRLMGSDPSRAEELTLKAEDLAFGTRSEIFRPAPFALEALSELKSAGYLLGVVSNWDYTLHRVLAMFGFNQILNFALASLEEGFEKPDPRLFQAALSLLKCNPGEVLHVGDDPLDDYKGAGSAGLAAVLFDRSQEPALPFRISDLRQIAEVAHCLT